MASVIVIILVALVSTLYVFEFSQNVTTVTFFGPSNSTPEIHNVTYVGAVIEYQPFRKWSETEKGHQVLRINADNILRFAAEAKKWSADILVAPEYGLQGIIVFKNNDDFLTTTQWVPNPEDKVTPCGIQVNSTFIEIIKILSCGARLNGMYLVVGMAEMEPCDDKSRLEYPWKLAAKTKCPESGFFAYNSQVVFDRNGTVVARYRKQHLYLEEEFTPGDQDDSKAVFETDFGVTFGLQICFDIVFEHPGPSNVRRGVKDIAMSTAWVDQLPFDLAISIQDGWSQALQANHLVSGYHYPQRYKLGSGIFRSYAKEPPNYTFDKCSGNVLLISSVKTISNTANRYQSKPKHEKPINKKIYYEIIDNQVHKVDKNVKNNKNCTNKHSILYQDLSYYNKTLLSPSLNNRSLNTATCCQNSICCHLNYRYEGNQTYFLMVFDGYRPVGKGNYQIGAQQCAVVLCNSENIDSCANPKNIYKDHSKFGPFNLTSSGFGGPDVYPIANHKNLSLISDISYGRKGDSFFISSDKSTENLLVLALYARVY